MLDTHPSKRQFHARHGKMDLCGIQYMVMCKRSDISIGFVWKPVIVMYKRSDISIGFNTSFLLCYIYCHIRKKNTIECVFCSTGNRLANRLSCVMYRRGHAS